MTENEKRDNTSPDPLSPFCGNEQISMQQPLSKPARKRRIKSDPAPKAAKGRKEEKDTENAREKGVQVLARAAEMLRLLKNAPAGMTQAEMAP